MKYFSTTLFLVLAVFFTNSVFSQDLKYGNEWIDYSKDHYKIKVSEDGVYRISKSILESNGVLASGSDYKMYNNGKEIPIFVSNDGTLGGNDFIEFYGSKLDGSFDTQMFEKPEHQLHTYISQFTDTASYFLVVDPGATNLRLKETTNNLSSAPAAEEYFIHKSVYFANNSHFNGVGKRFSGVNVYLSQYEEGEGWIGDVFGLNFQYAVPTVKKSLPTPNIYPSGPAADIEMKIIGQSDDFFTNNDHTVQIKLNGEEIIYEKYEGYTVKKYIKENHPLTGLSSPNTEFEFTALGFASKVDRQGISYITIDYPRDFNFSGLNQFLFNLEVDGIQTNLIEIENFDGGGVAPILLDINNNVRIEGVTTGNKVSYHLPIASNKNRKLFIYQNTATVVKQVNNLSKISFTDFSQAANQGDYIIISQTELLKDGAVSDYAAYRTSVDGGEHITTIADVEDLYDQFAVGIRKHPMAINNFMEFARDTWDMDVENLFLIGKSIKNSKCRTNPDNWQKNLVPTYGDTPSDIKFGTPAGKHIPTIAVGRLSATVDAFGDTPHTRDYLNKVIEYEASEVYTCDAIDLDWKKQVLHISGGTDLEQQETFNRFLNKYERIIEDTLYGGNVFQIYKDGSGVVTIPPDELLDSLINKRGLGIICFFGHANGLIWEVDIKNASNYENKGKYPFIMANSCFVGDIHKSFADDNMLSMSEEWVMEADAGAIAYLAAVQFGFPPSLDAYSESMYRQISYGNYNRSIGSSMLNTISKIYTANPKNVGIQITSEEMVLQGDPSVIINYAPKPEFEVKNSDIFFEPQLVSTRLDSFRVNLVISNLGTFNAADSITLCIDRKYADGTVENVANPRFATTSFQDTLGVNIYTDPLNGFGENEITVSVDCNNDIDELCEDNNISTASIFVSADNLVPVNPCEFSIVNKPGFKLQASTATPILQEQEYIFQLDTTELFNSGLFNEQKVISGGGIVEWEPNFNFSNSSWQGVVFYWRVAKVDPNTTNWRNSSFIYDENLDSGWNQSDYYQFTRGTKSNEMTLNELNRQFEYRDQVKSIKAKTGYVSLDGVFGGIGSNQYQEVDVEINNVKEVTWSCLGEGSCNYEGGIQFVLLNSATFRPSYSEIGDVDMSQLQDPNCFAGTSPCCENTAKGTAGNIHCRAQNSSSFDFETRTIADLQNIINFIDNIPNGYYVLVKSIQKHNLDTGSNPQVISYLSTIHNRLESMGATGIKNITSNAPFLLLLRKGVPADVFEPEVLIGNAITDVLEFDRDVESKWYNGAFQSSLIGPADEWQSVFVKTFNNDPSFSQSDEYQLNIYGVKPDGTRELLSGEGNILGEINFTGNELVTPISKINAVFYPYIVLELESEDLVNNTPPQLDYWRVHFEGVTELAFDTGSGLVYESDTLFLDKPFDSTIPIDTIELGESFDLSVAIQNISAVDADSILVVYEVIDENNVIYNAGSALQAPLAAGETGIATGSFSTSQLHGLNYLYVKLNPIAGNPYYQREKFGFNNILILPFFIGGDTTNPLLDVTFDGVHILDGDIVAAEPEILISVLDDSPFLPLDNQDIANITLSQLTEDANGTTISTEIELSDSSIGFSPANIDRLSEENLAQITINHPFEDGEYCLEVEAEDIAGNAAGQFAYKITFEVKNESSISHIYNYPNPFTSSTQFLFTLTGLKVPEIFKIQILSVGGKIVREIDKLELGNLHIGRNITDYRWDGHDQNGNPLGNGVYVYRIVSSKVGDKETGYYNIYNEAEKSKAAEEEYNKSGFGKMYIMR